jgi:HK97 gp10 family phage protein
MAKSQVYGLSEINEVLKQLPPRIADRLLQNATQAGARVVLKEIKSRAPRHEGRASPASARYGTIVENLAVKQLSVLKGTTARGSRVTTGDAFWAVFYELGTARQPARPFMRPGFDAAGSDAVNAIAGSLYVGVEREATKLAGEYGVAKRSFGVR